MSCCGTSVATSEAAQASLKTAITIPISTNMTIAACVQIQTGFMVADQSRTSAQGAQPLGSAIVRRRA